MRRLLASLLVFTPFLACTIGAGSFAGKTCDTQADCPPPYVCAQVRPGGSSCELLHGIDDSVGDGGTGGGGGGVTVDWCHDAQPIISANCVSNCHTPPFAYSGSPTTFRLDMYKVDGGQGAYDMRDRIGARASMGDMPPLPIASPRPTPAEVLVLVNWVSGGGVECVTTDGGP